MMNSQVDTIRSMPSRPTYLLVPYAISQPEDVDISEILFCPTAKALSVSAMNKQHYKTFMPPLDYRAKSLSI